ncbi:MAG: YihY family inner membrane protein [Verrucomicrobiales bacterium]|jgi:YihY family inner membrane protein
MRRLGTVLKVSFVRFFSVAGSDHAAAFAFYAFFSLFPVLLLLVSGASLFVERDEAEKTIIESIQPYLPIEEKHKEDLAEKFGEFVDNPAPVRFIGILSLLWAGIRFFKSLVHVQNLIWRCREIPWWHTPVKSATMLITLSSALILGIGAPVMLQTIHSLPLVQADWLDAPFEFGESMIPPLVLFYGLFLFYKLSPQTSVFTRDVWLPALLAAVLLTLARKSLLVLVQMTIDQLGVYQSIGMIIALLWSMYLSGQIIIWGGCLGAAIHETRPAEDDPDSLI